MRTFSPKPADITRAWRIVDADGLVLGRLATEVAAILRGKHKPTFAPNTDMGDHVIVINADKVVLTSGKAETKMAYRHSGYPGGLTATSYGDLMIDRSDDVVRNAVTGMLPEEPAGTPDGHQAEGLPGCRPPPRRPVPRTPRAPRRPPHGIRPERGLGTRPADGSGRNDHPRTIETPRETEREEHAVANAAPICQTTGRRKQAVARVRIRPGQGGITVNGSKFEDYFTSATHRMIVTEPLRLTETTESWDIDVTIDGGGVSGQAGAFRLGIARALCELDPEMRTSLKKAGFLTRDARGEGVEEVRPEEGPQGAPVLQAVVRWSRPGSAPTGSGVSPTSSSRPS